jgi:hypothetical protein
MRIIPKVIVVVVVYSNQYHRYFSSFRPFAEL